MKPRTPLPATPSYDAWIVAERKAAEAERLMRETRSRVARRRGAPVVETETAALAAELQKEAAALFARAMEEMESAVRAALSNTHMRLH